MSAVEQPYVSREQRNLPVLRFVSRVDGDSRLLKGGRKKSRAPALAVVVGKIVGRNVCPRALLPLTAASDLVLLVVQRG